MYFDSYVPLKHSSASKHPPGTLVSYQAYLIGELQVIMISLSLPDERLDCMLLQFWEVGLLVLRAKESKGGSSSLKMSL